jgi:hypothetical protein
MDIDLARVKGATSRTSVRWVVLLGEGGLQRAVPMASRFDDQTCGVAGHTGVEANGLGQRCWSGGAAVFVDESTEDVNPFDAPDPFDAGGCDVGRRDGHVEVDAAVRAGRVCSA